MQNKRLIPLFILASLLIFSCKQKKEFGFINEEEASQRINRIIDSINEPQIPNDTINLIEFSNHLPDEEGTVNFHPYIKEAIDSLEKMGGGWLLFANTQDITSWLRYTQTYRIEGPIDLKSNMGLLIDRSVRLFFPFEPEDYLVNGKGVLTRYEGTTIYSFSPLIRAFNQHDIAIQSRGNTGAMPRIDGDGEKWQRWMWEGEKGRRAEGLKASYQLLKDVNNADVPIAERVYTDPEKDYFRPETMEFFLCQDLKVEGIKITNSPFWAINPVFSNSCTFRNLAFDAMNVNNDGIDPESSKNVLIENIMFGNHDDNVAIKAGRDKEGRDGALVADTKLENIKTEYIQNNRITGPTENVVIRNCHFYGHNAICIGSEMSGGVRNIFAVNNYSVKEVNMALFIKSSRLRGGTVENVYINDLTMNRANGEVISIVPNYDQADNKPYPPVFKNIQVQNLTCDTSKAGILIHGWYDEPVKNVYFQSLDLNSVSQKPMEVNQALNVHFNNVQINDTTYNKELNRHEKGEKPPEKI